MFRCVGAQATPPTERISISESLSLSLDAAAPATSGATREVDDAAGFLEKADVAGCEADEGGPRGSVRGVEGDGRACECFLRSTLRTCSVAVFEREPDGVGGRNCLDEELDAEGGGFEVEPAPAGCSKAEWIGWAADPVVRGSLAGD